MMLESLSGLVGVKNMSETRKISEKETIVKIIMALHYKLYPNQKFIKPRESLKKMEGEIEAGRLFESRTERQCIREESTTCDYCGKTGDLLIKQMHENCYTQMIQALEDANES